MEMVRQAYKFVVKIFGNIIAINLNFDRMKMIINDYASSAGLVRIVWQRNKFVGDSWEVVGLCVGEISVVCDAEHYIQGWS